MQPTEKQVMKAYEQIEKSAELIADAARTQGIADPDHFVQMCDEHITTVQAAVNIIKQSIKKRRF